MNEQQASEPKKPKKKKLKMIVLIGIFLTVALLIFLYWVVWGRFTISTNDAYVHGHTVEVFSKVKGSVYSIKTQETCYVQEGEVLLELDATDYVIAFENSKALLANTVREVIKMFDEVYQKKAFIDQLEAQLAQAQFQYINREALLPIGAISKENFQNSETNLLVAQSSLKQAVEHLKGSEAQIYNTTVATHPKVEEAKERVRVAWLNLQRTLIKAPVNGYVAQMNTQVGESVNTQSPLISIVPLQGLWANANFKEVDLRDIHIGQEVEMSSSIYGPKVKFKGRVLGISPGTGSVFSVLPPQNATGNWIQIVQRVPVKVSLDAKQLQEYPLRLGLSLDAKIYLKKSTGETVKCHESPANILKTTIFQEQMSGVESIINQVIQNNIKPN
jgi:membrane fusion protein (multidrug efflux system)